MTKKSKILWHLKFWLFFLKSKLLPTQKISSKKNQLSMDDKKKIDYLNNLSQKFSLENAVSMTEVPKFKHSSGYYYDLYRVIIKFPRHFKFHYLLGDVSHVPVKPTFVKSRPIAANNQNSVLLPLNTRRHANFIVDKKKFDEKIAKIVWRGGAYRSHRKEFLEKTFHLDFCDVGCTGKNQSKYSKKWLSVDEQLNYKFIFSIEGNDVATNLKWIMSSNSICFMFKPKFETWFMEGTLIPNVHYVELKDDLSDLEDKFNFYTNNPDEALKIIKNANDYVAQFKSIELQYQLATGVVEKYARLSNQVI
jgi:hypothetical protein